MSAKEATMLDELRSKELRSLSDSEYKIIRNQVESNGIRSLRGASAQAVFAALRDRDKAMNKAVLVELRKSLDVAKHGNHDQKTHGAWADESEGEYEDNQGLHGTHRGRKDDSEGEFEDDDDDMEAMDMMDIMRPPKITASQRTEGEYITPWSIKPTRRS